MIALAASLLFAGAPAGPPAPAAATGCSVRRLDAEILRPDDYPADALLDGMSGTVRVEIDVADSGCPTTCRIAASSGLESFDRAVCSAYMERARFRPARDAAFRPVPTTLSRTVRWALP